MKLSSKLRQFGNLIKAGCRKIWINAGATIGTIKDTGSKTITEDDEKDVDKDEQSSQTPNNDNDDYTLDEDDENPRCDWKVIDAIPDSKYEDLIRLRCDPTGTWTDARVLGHSKGSYHRASCLGLLIGNKVRTYYVRVPGHGTHEHWTPEDAYMLEREVQIIEYIRTHTKAPVPEIIDYSTSHDNLLGHPYILMTKIDGRNASSIWNDKSYFEDGQAQYSWRLADDPPTEVKQKRITFLRSLARIMTDIGTLSFDHIGMPIIFDIVFAQPAFNPSEPETFTIHHNDLDLQNILVDEDGNITGIIDWDRAMAAPRCAGAAAVPLFLQKDWLPNYLNTLDIWPHMAWNTHHYRELYAAALVEAGNPDAKYTIKSAIYQAALMAIYEGGDVYDFVKKLLQEIPQCRVQAGEFCKALGSSIGWPAAEKMLTVELAKIFEPELPRQDLLQDLCDELSLEDWKEKFGEFLLYDPDFDAELNAEP
ncbi:hypothetical protein P153DRAFT_343352 [Dothidotthia symphoricarpi CBS 119687]|uniref:Aminoglycoside phosphotransferase domain-containing protein n=1 Tax=Dothidotthia symphoricarpi CBS 119687 TaxID=1392245 RepID=A0A6A6ABR3_9PLEO|nr:uncharacterized protein P153DRAFT_343352 [Dothidotthia symphoricarpi CBS 119687]KAF2128151.1 hypothetical protein P153DRAFT_343352 [Dothidotthia symphoricarpi CBS 119687]